MFNLTTTWEYGWMLYAVVGIVVFLWVYCILRVAKDISARTNHFGMQLLSIILVLILTPIIWLPIYFLIRPIWYDMENYKLKSAMLADMIVCVYCEHWNNPNHEYCVYCWWKLKVRCKECNKAFSIGYDFCPFCGCENHELESIDKL